MSRPVEMGSVGHLKETARDFPTTFVMFYVPGSVRDQSFSPIFRSLCSEYATPTTAFVRMDKKQFSRVCDKYDVPRGTDLTFVVFKDAKQADSIEGNDTRMLERFVECNAIPSQRHRAKSPRRRGHGRHEIRPYRNHHHHLYERHVHGCNDCCHPPVRKVRDCRRSCSPELRHPRPSPRIKSVRFAPDGHGGIEANWMDRAGPILVERQL